MAVPPNRGPSGCANPARKASTRGRTSWQKAGRFAAARLAASPPRQPERVAASAADTKSVSVRRVMSVLLWRATEMRGCPAGPLESPRPCRRRKAGDERCRRPPLVVRGRAPAPPSSERPDHRRLHRRGHAREGDGAAKRVRERAAGLPDRRRPDGGACERDGSVLENGAAEPGLGASDEFPPPRLDLVLGRVTEAGPPLFRARDAPAGRRRDPRRRRASAPLRAAPRRAACGWRGAHRIRGREQ